MRRVSTAATPVTPDPKDTPLPTATGGVADADHAVPRSAAMIDARGRGVGTSVNPWMFVPVLYFMQFLPNGLVTSMFGATYKSLGVDNLKIATWTGLAALPWSFKMFWGPLVDLNFTKRKWTLAMQVLLFATLLVTAGAMGTANFFPLT